tara:strand:- start:111 stop:506 length:396 start_codon:yes stop_codon:yes gene_type:complete
MAQIFFLKLWSFVGDADQVKIQIKALEGDAPCKCDSPWYSPCVVWGSKGAKDASCNKNGTCEDKYSPGAGEANSKPTKCKDGSKNCAKVSNKFHCNQKIKESGKHVFDPFQNRGGNRTGGTTTPQPMWLGN